MQQSIAKCEGFQTVGRLRSIGGVLRADLPASMGELCRIEPPNRPAIWAEVIGLSESGTALLPFHQADGLHLDDTVVATGRRLRVPVGPELLGRVVDGVGEPIDGRGPIMCRHRRPVENEAPAPLTRPRIRQPMITGQRAIDSMLTIGQGQRMGLFAGSGVGKSTLLGEIAKGASSDMNVIALVGERGREVAPFIEDCLGEEGLRKSVVVVSTSDESPLMRVRAAQTAVAISSWFRDQGCDVLFMLDSLTRMAMAQREIGLQLGEPPSARGYTPSVFSLLARLLEQLGSSQHGTLTSLLTVLVDGDDTEEPISDAVRSIVDGHIVLTRKLANEGRFPAIDVSRSISRIMRDVTTPEHQKAAEACRSVLAIWDDVADLVRVGAYAAGSAPEVDRAIQLRPRVENLLKQSMNERSSWNDTLTQLGQIAAAAKG